jgi:KaiC/GvpD/RAD55 family RecA-like ATPase
MERVPTGIQGLDELIEGGVPKGSSIMLNGPVGSYRDLLALEFLYRATLKDESAVYVSFEKTEDDVMEMASVFNWKLGDELKAHKFAVIKTELFNFEQFVSNTDDALFTYKATRAVIDSTTFLMQFFNSDFKLRQGLGELRRVMKRHGTTALLLDNVDQNDTPESVVDGVIETRLVQTEQQLVHALAIRSMQSTDFSPVQHPLELTKSGLKVHKFPLVV